VQEELVHINKYTLNCILNVPSVKHLQNALFMVKRHIFYVVVKAYCPLTRWTPHCTLRQSLLKFESIYKAAKMELSCYLDYQVLEGLLRFNTGDGHLTVE